MTRSADTDVVPESVFTAMKAAVRTARAPAAQEAFLLRAVSETRMPEENDAANSMTDEREAHMMSLKL